MRRRTQANRQSNDIKLILAGVGGQGVVFATRLLAQTAIAMGLPVLASETHGMSQRGGSVLAHLKLGGTKAPLIRRGTADVLLAFDRDEAVKSLGFLRHGGIAFVNAADGLGQEIEELLPRLETEVHCLPATSMALALGSSAVANVVLIGYAASHPAFHLPIDRLREVLAQLPPERARLNLQALESGSNAWAPQT